MRMISSVILTICFLLISNTLQLILQINLKCGKFILKIWRKKYDSSNGSFALFFFSRSLSFEISSMISPAYVPSLHSFKFCLLRCNKFQKPVLHTFPVLLYLTRSHAFNSQEADINFLSSRTQIRRQKISCKSILQKYCKITRLKICPKFI